MKLTNKQKEQLEGHVAVLWNRHHRVVDEYVDNNDIVEGALNVSARNKTKFFAKRLQVVRHMKRELCGLLLARGARR